METGEEEEERIQEELSDIKIIDNELQLLEEKEDIFVNSRPLSKA